VTTYLNRVLATSGPKVAPASQAILFLTILFIVSPLSLYFSRLSSLLVVFGLIAALWLFILVSNFSIRRVPTPVDIASAVFLGYLSLNCIVSLVLGHPINNTIAEIVAPLQMYLCFQGAKRIEVSREVVGALLKWMLIFAIARAAWEIFTTLTLVHLPAPIYGSLDKIPLGVIGRFVYERPFDPVSGMMFAVALMLYAFGIERRLALLAAIVTAVVLILGMTRSEWIAGIAAIFIATLYAGELAKAARIFAVIGLVLATEFFFSPDLRQALSDRLITQTVDQITLSEQITSPGAASPGEAASSGQATPPRNHVGALRILEFRTAFNEFKTAPLFGHGLGSSFGTEVSYDGEDPSLIQLHNSYLNLLASAGIVGISLLLIALLKVRQFLLLGLRHSDRYVRALFCTGAGMLAWYGVFMGFQPIYSAYHLPVLIGTIWGLAAQLSKTVEGQPAAMMANMHRTWLASPGAPDRT
jgi:O-antigen ligase